MFWVSEFLGILRYSHDCFQDGVYERLENFLLRRGETLVSIDVKDKKTGNTPLIWAAKRGHAKVRDLLLELKIETYNVRGYKNGLTLDSILCTPS